MADNIAITAGSGINVATDDDGTAHHQYVKLEFGGDNTQTKVSTTNPLPITLANATTGSVAVYFDQSNPNIKANYGSGTFLVAFDRANPSVSIGGASASVGIYFDRGNPAVNLTSGTLTSITNTVAVYFDRANPSIVASNISGMSQTASIFTTSGAYTGNSVSGLTVISPSANYSFKIFAFSLTTTAQSNIFAKFTNGAGTSPTEYWRVALQAPSAGISGANLAVTPPGHLWATGTSTTLSLVLDSASTVHYSVSYVKETA